MSKTKTKSRQRKAKFKVRRPGGAAPKRVVEIVNPTQFDQLVLGSDRPAVVDFWAEWCMPCKATAPHFAAAAETFGDQVTFCKVNTEKNPTLAQRYRIRSIPTMLLFDGGEVVDVHIGASQQAGIERMAKKLLARRGSAVAGQPSTEAPAEGQGVTQPSGGFIDRIKALLGGKGSGQSTGAGEQTA